MGRRVSEIYDEFLLPLLDKEIIIPGRETKKAMLRDRHNFFFELNESKMDTSILKR